MASQETETPEKRHVGNLNQAAREKYWDELSIEEKIERTRQVVKNDLRTALEQNRKLSEMVDHLAKVCHLHSHNGDAVVVPVDLLLMKSHRAEQYTLVDWVGGKSPTDRKASESLYF